eukprot:COSAG02_NODE_17311_length_1013_cov_0.948578_1_plen_37_part_10
MQSKAKQSKALFDETGLGLLILYIEAHALYLTRTATT